MGQNAKRDPVYRAAFLSGTTLSVAAYLAVTDVFSLSREILWLIYIAGDGLRHELRFGFLSYTEIGSRDHSLCNVKCSAQYNVAIRSWIQIRVHTRVRFLQCKCAITAKQNALLYRLITFYRSICRSHFLGNSFRGYYHALHKNWKLQRWTRQNCKNWIIARCEALLKGNLETAIAIRINSTYDFQATQGSEELTKKRKLHSNSFLYWPASLSSNSSPKTKTAI